MEICTHADFVKFLNDELVRRKESNRSYSLRAFARDLTIEPSLLSKMLRGQYRLTPKMIFRIGEAAGLESSSLSNLAKVIENDLQQVRKSKIDKGLLFEPLADDHFKYIAEWYHVALLHLVETVDFRPDAKWCAERLNLDVGTVQDSLERLKRLHLVVENEDGGLELSGVQYSTLQFGDTSHLHRNLQKQMLEKAITALEEVPFNKRHQSTLTFAVSPRLVPKLVQEINKFRREVNVMAGSESDKLEEVYNFSVSLYPVTKRS